MSISPSFIFRFGNFEIDPAKFELRERGLPRPVEPQVLSLLILLATNADRMVSKDELVEKVWGGRFISDSAIATRVKEARRALNDDGRHQRCIRTIHGRGFHFCADVTIERAAELPAGSPSGNEPPAEERPSIAVMPFRLLGEPGPLAFLADALAEELISDLSRLRSLMVIARASSFRLRGGEVSARSLGATLGVRYCLSGTIEPASDRVTLSLELAHAPDDAVIWSERFTCGRAELQAMRSEILVAVLANLELRIVQHEVQRARTRPEAELGAWSRYHLGLDHMYRFNKPDNGRARQLFEQALAIQPQFSRALSGLSFTAFQDRFLQYSPDLAATARQARERAEQALRYDPLDPFAHLNLGRSLWFDDAIPESIERLTECIALSPNYAQAVYSKSWAEMTQGNQVSSDSDAALALRLSPLDPMRYAMLAVRSVSALLRGDCATAADLGERAARSPGAHKLVVLIAALGAQAAGRSDRAAVWVGRARQLDPGLTRQMFLNSFPFAPSAGRELIEKGLHDLGL